MLIYLFMGFPRGAAAKNLPADAGDGGREDLPQEGTATTPVFSAGGSQGQRSLAGYSPRGHRVGQAWVSEQMLV